MIKIICSILIAFKIIGIGNFSWWWIIGMIASYCVYKSIKELLEKGAN